MSRCTSPARSARCPRSNCGTTAPTSRSSRGSSRKGYTDKWNLYHLSERLRLKGWLIPAYPMPDDLTDIVVQRIVVRNGLSRNLAESLLTDIQRGGRLPRRARVADADRGAR